MLSWVHHWQGLSMVTRFVLLTYIILHKSLLKTLHPLYGDRPPDLCIFRIHGIEEVVHDLSLRMHIYFLFSCLVIFRIIFRKMCFRICFIRIFVEIMFGIFLPTMKWHTKFDAESGWAGLRIAYCIPLKLCIGRQSHQTKCLCVCVSVLHL